MEIHIGFHKDMEDILRMERGMKITGKYGKKITPEMIGVFFEDINYAADGGLYAEMIENRSFEAREAHGTPGNFYALDDPGYAWHSVYEEDEQAPVMQYVTGTPLSTVNPHYLRFTAKAPGQGVANQAYDGIYLEKGSCYKVSFYARCVRYQGETFTVSVRKEGKVYAQAQVRAVLPVPYFPFTDLKMAYEPEQENEALKEALQKIKELQTMNAEDRSREQKWNHYELELTALETVRGAEFVLSLDAPGAVEFDLISMMPADAVAGIFRRDLFEALASMKPGFIRFPGGCIVEGISLENRYQWKQTVGPLQDRKYIPNLWAFDDDRSKTDPDVMRETTSHYGQSYGLGFYEYFLLCELLGAKALPVVGVGAACQFRSTEMVSTDSEAFNTYIRDALDLIEFANGSPRSTWGSLRAKMGHPEPFHLTMLAVGNEQWETKEFDFYERTGRFEKAIHEVAPEIRLIGSAGPIIDLPVFEEAWNFYRQREAEKPGFCYAVDEHYYVPDQWMYEHIDFYDRYPRNVAVFAGEYAAHTKDRANNMQSALAEAAFLTGVEKNADVVKLASYAPLFNRIGHSQWKPDLIWFDDAAVYLTPNYYVQKLYANHLGDHTLWMDEEEVKALRQEKIYVSLSETVSEKGTEEGQKESQIKEGQTKDATETEGKTEIILKAVNAGDEDYLLPLTDETGHPIEATGCQWILEATGESADKKTKEESANMPQPSHIREEKTAIHGSLLLPAGTFTVVRFMM